MFRLKKANNEIKLVYSDQKLPTKIVKTIFLAGPTPRNNNVESWRKEAIDIFRSKGFNGHLLIPEPSNGKFEHEYTDQINWELEAMNMADVILFWIPRDLKDMPAFTTNVEFGKWVESGKIVFGFPEEAEKMRYLEYLALDNGVEIFNDLDSLIDEAIQKFGKGEIRYGGECKVPLFVWQTQYFQDWYQAQKNAGNKLEDAKVLWNFIMPKQKIMFIWVLKVKMYVKDEDRYKDNEFVISRTSTASIVIYKKEKNLLDSKIILVKEFRSPAATQDGYILELPGGSSFNQDEDMYETIQHEIKEEVGFVVDSSRINYVQQRQLYGTLLANKTSLFSLEITDEELEWFYNQEGKVNGVIEDTEMTYTVVKTVREILDEELLDWSNIGMIMKVLS